MLAEVTHRAVYTEAMPAQVNSAAQERVSSPKSQELTSDFFYHGVEWPAFESANGQNSTVISESKLLGHNASSFGIFWVGTSWSVSGLKWFQVHLLIFCQGCVFSIQVVNSESWWTKPGKSISAWPGISVSIHKVLHSYILKLSAMLEQVCFPK